jgi:hypothetical protein
MRLWIWGFHKMQRISWPALNRLTSLEGFYSMEKVSNVTDFVVYKHFHIMTRSTTITTTRRNNSDLGSIKHIFCKVRCLSSYVIYSIKQRHVSVPSVFTHLHTVNSAAKLSDVKLEQDRILILTPSVSATLFENFISFPWQWNTNHLTNNSLFEQPNYYARRSGMSVCRSEIFYTQNTIQTRNVNRYVKNRQAAF